MRILRLQLTRSLGEVVDVEDEALDLGIADDICVIRQ